MTTIKAKVIDGFHLKLEEGIRTKTGDEDFTKNYREEAGCISLRAWSNDVDSPDFVENLHKSKNVEPHLLQGHEMGYAYVVPEKSLACIMKMATRTVLSKGMATKSATMHWRDCRPRAGRICSR